MKRDSSELAIYDFRNYFLGRKYATNREIKDFYSKFRKNLSDADMRRIVYGLEKEKILYSSGSGVYCLFNKETNSDSRTKIQFNPVPSENLRKIKMEIWQKFPFVECIFWETRSLHEFMVQQPNTNLILLECEKGTEEAVFDHFNLVNIVPVFLDPDRAMMERYVISHSENLVISRMITRSPKIGKSKNGAYAKIEKILVDLLIDGDRFYMFQGSELVNIYEEVFNNFLINEDTLLNYARRRHAEERLKEFILQNTNLETRVFQRGGDHDFTALTNR